MLPSFIRMPVHDLGTNCTSKNIATPPGKQEAAATGGTTDTDEVTANFVDLLVKNLLDDDKLGQREYMKGSSNVFFTMKMKDVRDLVNRPHVPLEYDSDVVITLGKLRTILVHRKEPPELAGIDKDTPVSDIRAALPKMQVELPDGLKSLKDDAQVGVRISRWPLGGTKVLKKNLSDTVWKAVSKRKQTWPVKTERFRLHWSYDPTLQNRSERSAMQEFELWNFAFSQALSPKLYVSGTFRLDKLLQRRKEELENAKDALDKVTRDLDLASKQLEEVNSRIDHWEKQQATSNVTSYLQRQHELKEQLEGRITSLTEAKDWEMGHNELLNDEETGLLESAPFYARALSISELGSMDLHEWLYRKKSLNLLTDAQIAEHGQKLVSMLNKTGSAGLLLLDVKPMNIVVMDRSGTVEFRFIDFDPDFCIGNATCAAPINSALLLISMGCDVSNTKDTQGVENVKKFMKPVVDLVQTWARQYSRDQKSCYGVMNTTEESMRAGTTMADHVIERAMHYARITSRGECNDPSFDSTAAVLPQLIRRSMELFGAKEKKATESQLTRRLAKMLVPR